MISAFQSGAFQFNAFQIGAAVVQNRSGGGPSAYSREDYEAFKRARWKRLTRKRREEILDAERRHRAVIAAREAAQQKLLRDAKAGDERALKADRANLERLTKLEALAEAKALNLARALAQDEDDMETLLLLGVI